LDQEHQEDQIQAWEALRSQWGPVIHHLDCKISALQESLRQISQTKTLEDVRVLQAQLEVCRQMRELPAHAIQLLKVGETRGR